MNVYSACTNAPNLGQSICCQAQMREPAILCPNNAQFELLNGQAKPCQLGASNQCGIGYTCTTSPNRGQNICCQTQTPAAARRTDAKINCPNNSPYEMLNGQIKPCQIGIPNQCGNGYSCSAIPDIGLSICCQSQAPKNTIVCPNNVPFEVLNGQAKPCQIGFSNQCGIGYTCTTSPSMEQPICCRAELQPPATIICPNNVQFEMLNGEARPCKFGFPNQCSNGYTCIIANRSDGQAICCESQKLKIPTGCPNDDPLEQMNGLAKSCQFGLPNQCSQGNVCAFNSLLGQHVCCQSVGLGMNSGCPQNLPFELLNGQLRSCQSNGISKCGNGYNCAFNSIFGQHICCQTDSTRTSLTTGDRKL